MCLFYVVYSFAEISIVLSLWIRLSFKIVVCFATWIDISLYNLFIEWIKFELTDDWIGWIVFEPLMILYFLKFDIWSDFGFLYLFKGTYCCHLVFYLSWKLVYLLKLVFVGALILIYLALIFWPDIFKLNNLLLFINLNIVQLLLLNCLKWIVLILTL